MLLKRLKILTPPMKYLLKPKLIIRDTYGANRANSH